MDRQLVKHYIYYNVSYNTNSHISLVQVSLVKYFDTFKVSLVLVRSLMKTNEDICFSVATRTACLHSRFGSAKLHQKSRCLRISLFLYCFRVYIYFLD